MRLTAQVGGRGLGSLAASRAAHMTREEILEEKRRLRAQYAELFDATAALNARSNSSRVSTRYPCAPHALA